jgi:hypothetical protein
VKRDYQRYMHRSVTNNNNMAATADSTRPGAGVGRGKPPLPTSEQLGGIYDSLCASLVADAISKAGKITVQSTL